MINRPTALLISMVLVVALLGGFGTSFAQNVPFGDRAYELIDLASTRRLLSGPQYIRPMDRLQVAKLIVQIENHRRSGVYFPSSISSELSRQIEVYRREIDSFVNPEWWNEARPYQARIKTLARELLPAFWPASMWTNDGHMVSVEYPGGSWLTLDPTYGIRFDRESSSEDNVIRRYWGISLEASPLPWLFAYLRWQDIEESGRGPYWSRSQIIDDNIGYISRRGDPKLGYEELSSGVIVKHGPLMLLFGRDRARFGPGRYGNLLMSGQTYSFPQFRFTVDIGPDIRYAVLVGSLSPWPSLRDTLYMPDSGYLRTQRRSKYLTAHRLEVAFSRSVILGINEAVVYGERGLDFAYLNPVTVYFAEEHGRGDQDNSLIAIDLKVNPTRGFSVWGELMLDDFTSSKSWGSYYGNKGGWLVGGSLAGPGGMLPIEAGFEHAGIRPYVFSHIYPINTYKHWNAPLGLPLQSNSDRTLLWLTWWTVPSLRCGIEYDYLRHGENIISGDSLMNHGGDWDESFRREDSEYAPFLGGRRVNCTRIAFWADWEVWEGFVWTLAGGYDTDDGLSDEGWFGSLGILWNLPADRRWSLKGRSRS